MSYPCICRTVCHIHGKMWRATLEYAKANRRHAIHRTNKTDERMSIIVLRYARRRMRIVSQGRLTLWRHSASRCDVTPRYAITWLFTRKTPSYKTYTCQNTTTVDLNILQRINALKCSRVTRAFKAELQTSISHTDCLQQLGLCREWPQVFDTCMHASFSSSSSSSSS